MGSRTEGSAGGRAADDLRGRAAMAQVPTGSITGTVQDSQGLPVEAAGHGHTHQSGDERTTFTSVTGSSGGVTSGIRTSSTMATYKVSASKTGFKLEEVTGIKLDASTVYSVKPIVMEVGATTETPVVVEGGAELVNTTSAEVTSTVEKQQIDDLPILNRKPNGPPWAWRRGVQIAAPEAWQTTTINGQRSSFTNVTLDGIQHSGDNFIRTNLILDFLPNLPI